MSMLSNTKLVKLPGLVDPHVHLRDPGQTEKEDFSTGTKAALAGGYTTVLDMPNNKTPIFTQDALSVKIKTAEKKIFCDIGFYFGTVGDNLDEFDKVKNKVFGLKVYLNKTTGNLITDKNLLEKIFSAWTNDSPILIHAIDDTLDFVISVLEKNPRPVHIVHASSRHELTQIIKAKQKNLPITCGVTPHHLFLNENDLKALGPFGMMQPPLHSKRDVDFLWENLRYIDVIESDHAPHTKLEKEGATAPFGVPGLETTLPLLLTEVRNKKITIDDVVRLCSENPRKIFHVPDNNSYIKVDLERKWIIKNEDLQTKSAWTPFDGWKVYGKIEKVFLRGELVFDNGNFKNPPGNAEVLRR